MMEVLSLSAARPVAAVRAKREVVTRVNWRVVMGGIVI